MFNRTGKPKKHYQKVANFFSKMSKDEFLELNNHTKISFMYQGVTFTVYSEKEGIERIFPFDLFPRIITQREWEKIERGLVQRITALNLFLHDIYHDKKILKDRVIPYDLVLESPHYNKEMINLEPPGGVYTHVSGIDIIRHKDGEFYVLEDNLRSPSGVSYVLSNRSTMKKVLPNIFFHYEVSSVSDYPQQLLAMLKSVAPEGVDEPTCVVLTPGIYNSAYYEHTFLAHNMGVELVEGRDMFVDNNFVYMKTIYGPQKVDVIYRRVDDSFLDPLVFKPESLLGVPGIMAAYRAGNVTIVNAPGTGVADDKAIYAYVPQMIRYYLKEEPVLNNVPTYICDIEEDFNYVMDNMEKLVIKPVDESGGYGILIGAMATKEEIETYKNKIRRNRRKYIAQPIMTLSTHPTFIEESGKFEPRHIDLRTFLLYGKDFKYPLKGGLTRVALKKGSLIVNSSQGGGSKDTWVME
ncbi:circularly permuted type 2 ATP-grasp protein [Hydrogenivirga caldilitoris]|uniref:circularly permuted type 2 ATP-grasp protein n=1 Tax=Hydrogenivirga caldilitoris TaxID=246264 RepID=UPI001B860924|nr:circularly permuted type 2 ATP-grasp protein [Hydrogenivirga caldilitoris]